MSYQNGTATDIGNLMAQINTFLLLGHSLDPVYTGTGTGTITNLIGTAASVLEVITITFTSSTAFSVAGSVSGALAAGTVGVAYTSAVANFTVVAGGVAWVAGDTIIFTMTPPWVLKGSINVGTGTDTYYWQAPGNDGVSQIFVGMSRFADPTGDYDNIRIGGFTGFSGTGVAFASQPGAVSHCIMPGLRVGSFPYWMIANGRRFAIVTRPSTVYECAYMGFMNTYVSPGSWPYPLAIGGSMAFASEPLSTSVTWRWSYTGGEHTAYPMSNSVSGPGQVGDTYQMRLRDASGSWQGFSSNQTEGSHGAAVNGYMWPYSQTMDDFRPNLDGSYPLIPIVLSTDKGASQVQGSSSMEVIDTPNILGELDGICAVTGHGNAAENTITTNRITYLVVQNVFRSTKRDYFAMKLT
jgi:hypothetical protein